jgi:hypothetical protein
MHDLLSWRRVLQLFGRHPQCFGQSPGYIDAQLQPVFAAVDAAHAHASLSGELLLIEQPAATPIVEARDIDHGRARSHLCGDGIWQVDGRHVTSLALDCDLPFTCQLPAK